MSAERKENAEKPRENFGEEFCQTLLGQFGWKGPNAFQQFERAIKTEKSDVDLIMQIADKLISRGYPRQRELYRVLPDCPSKRSLLLHLLQDGVIPVTAPEARAGAKFVDELLSEREDLEEIFLADMPIEVAGQILTLELFSELDDQKKMEELRAWTTKALYRWYLGNLGGERPDVKKPSIAETIKRVPDKIYEDHESVRYQLVENYFSQRIMKSITDLGLDAGLEEVEKMIKEEESPDRKRFLSAMYERFYDIATQPLKGDFHEEILIKGKPKKFPSFEQRAFVYDFLNNGTRLLTADTGLGKTGAAYLAMENSDAEKVLVVVPASGKQTWVVEDQKLFKNPNNVFVINTPADLSKPEIQQKKYIVIGQQLLSTADHNPTLKAELQKYLLNPEQGIGVDAVILDETDNLHNVNTTLTKVTRTLVDGARSNYQQKTGKEQAPIIGISATPVLTKLSDLNVIMSMLYPEKFAASTKEITETQKTFSDTYLNRPELAYMSLVGEKRMFRWETASGVQELKYKPLEIEASPFELYLYDYIAKNLEVDALTKIRLLEDVMLNPHLVKAEIRQFEKPNKEGKQKITIPHHDMDEMIHLLKIALKEWKRQTNTDGQLATKDFLSADKLVELGLGDLVIGCYFHGAYENGIDTLIAEICKEGQTDDEQLLEIGNSWLEVGLSSKYKALQELIIKNLTWKKGEDGVLERNKVFIVSPGRMQGRTGDVLQKQITTEDGEILDVYTDYELAFINDQTLFKLLKRWVDENGLETEVKIIDGSVEVGKAREEVNNAWVNDPNFALLETTLESTFQSRDYTITNTIDDQGRRISGVTKVFLGWPWYWQQCKQMAGRSQRQGQILPVEIVILQMQDLLDKGKSEAVYFTYLLSRMTLSGINVSGIDKEFFDQKRVGNKIDLQSRESRFLWDAMNDLRGLSEDEMLEYLDRPYLDQQKSREELIAEKYYDLGNDIYKLAGYNAELVTCLINQDRKPNQKILSIGAGTLLLQRQLQMGIDNLDINESMMKVAWPEASEFGGRMIVGKASSLDSETFPDNHYDTVDLSFMLHWLKLNGDKKSKTPVEKSERVKALLEVNRVLKTDGQMILMLPEGAFDEETFATFCQTLEQNLGFKIDQSLSGKSYGVSEFQVKKRIGWSIIAKKVGEPDLATLELKNLAFCYDKTHWVSADPKDQKPQKEQKVSDKEYPKPELEIDFKRYIIESNTGRLDLDPTQEPKKAEENSLLNGTIYFNSQTPERNDTQNGLSEQSDNISEDPVISEIDTPLIFSITEGAIEQQSPVKTEHRNGHRTEISLDELESLIRGDSENSESGYKRIRNGLLRPIQRLTGVWKNSDEVVELGVTIIQELIQKGYPIPKTSKEAWSRIISEVSAGRSF